MDIVLIAFCLLPFAWVTGSGWLLGLFAALLAWPVIAFVLGPILRPQR